MLEYYYKDMARMRQIRRGPVAGHIDGLAEALKMDNYAGGRGKFILSLVGKFSRFAETTGVSEAELINEALVDRFINEKLAGEGKFHDAATAMRHMMKYLRGKGVIKPYQKGDSPFHAYIDNYAKHLTDIRGLTHATVTRYTKGAQRFLVWFKEHRRSKSLEKISGPDILDFISTQVALESSPTWGQNVCCDVRSFLRFLHWDGIIDSDLIRVVPKVRRYTLRTVPKHIPWEKVRTLIDSVDMSRPEGMRDKAIMLLLACLGLRGDEVQHLKLEQIDWRRAELHLPKTKNRKERVLPLPQEVGAALANYVLYSRPSLDVPYVFLKHGTPLGPLASDIGSIIKRHLLRSGIDAPSQGVRLLRHSLASRMVNTGVPIKDIADVLGHASIDTTAIYTKVDMAHLAAVALPFPGGAA